MAAMCHAVPGQSRRSRRNQNTHGQGCHAKVAGHGHHNRQIAVPIAHIILHDDARMMAAHFVSSGWIKIEPEYLARGGTTGLVIGSPRPSARFRGPGKTWPGPVFGPPRQFPDRFEPYSPARSAPDSRLAPERSR